MTQNASFPDWKKVVTYSAIGIQTTILVENQICKSVITGATVAISKGTNHGIEVETQLNFPALHLAQQDSVGMMLVAAQNHQMPGIKR